MAAPTYTCDLVTITTAESGTWGEISGYSSGGTPVLETDYFIQGTGCYSQSLGTKTGLVFSMYFDYGSDLSGVITGDKCVFFWQVLLAANAMDTFSNGGLRLAIGSGIGAFKIWFSGGKDFGRNPYGGWQNIAIYPNYTPDQVIGAPTGQMRYFGSLVNIINAVSKGNMHALDAIRYGRGEYYILYGDESTPATFLGMGEINDQQNNRWSLFQQEGITYLWKGLLSFGKDSSACFFSDENRSIRIDNTPRTYTNFNKIEINNVNSYIYWKNISFTASDPSQLSRGSFEVVNDCSVFLDACFFTDMSTFIFKSKSQITDSTFRRTYRIYQNNATFDNCVFDSIVDSISLVANNLTKVTNCLFISNGLNHAIYLGADCSGMSFSLIGNTYEGYASTNGNTGNEVIYNNSGGLVTLNITSGDIPTVRNGTNSSTSIVASVSLTLYGIVPGSEVTIVRLSDREILFHEESVGSSGESIFSYGSEYIGTDVDILVFNVQYNPTAFEYTLGSENARIPVFQTYDRVYLNV